MERCEFRNALGNGISRFFDITEPGVPLVQELLVFVRRVAPHDFHLDILKYCDPCLCLSGIHEGLADAAAKTVGLADSMLHPPT